MLARMTNRTVLASVMAKQADVLTTCVELKSRILVMLYHEEAICGANKRR